MQIDEKIIEHPSLKEIWIGNALIVTENIADSGNFDILIEAAY
jgi:predicted metalloendopeptidase